MTKLGVEVHTEYAGDGRGAGMGGGEGGERNQRIDAVVTLWAAGVQASPLGKMLGVPSGQTRMRAGG